MSGEFDWMLDEPAPTGPLPEPCECGRPGDCPVAECCGGPVCQCVCTSTRKRLEMAERLLRDLNQSWLYMPPRLRRRIDAYFKAVEGAGNRDTAPHSEERSTGELERRPSPTPSRADEESVNAAQTARPEGPAPTKGRTA